MALSNTDTYDNRMALDKWLEKNGTLPHVSHGYNGIGGVVISDYSKTKTTSTGFAHIVQFKIQSQIPVAPEFVAIFVANMKEFESSINTLIDEFFSNQTKIDGELDENYVKMKIDRIQEDYRKASRVVRPVEVIMEIKSINRATNGSTTIAGYVSRDSWIEVDGIAQFEEERQVILIPFDKWFSWLELVDPDRHEKIKREREAKLDEEAGL